MHPLIRTMSLRRTCREAVGLLIAREDRPLPFNDRVALGLHLVVCKACPLFERQVNTMGQALRRWRQETEHETLGANPHPDADDHAR